MADFYYSEKDILDKARGTDAYFRIKSILASIRAVDVEPVRRWIPVKERLPETDDMVLVIASGRPKENITLDNAYELASYNPDEGWIFDMWPEWEDANVTRWMPLPELPEEKEVII